MKKVLVIDDEVDFCLLMKQFLQRKGYAVEIAHTLAEGLDKLQEYHPDLVFLDNNLPDGTGWEMAFSLMRLHPKLKINLISAFKNLMTPVDSQQVRVLEKPVSFSALEAYLY
ncbi:response regulator [Dinghuibacter silviterrae]|uniref:Response regulator receiver domain-containing protein n=1 Tax=Dinghuibacter silviterrae TaxID=1539049 RepID=A0A4R8DQ10_9BACT|nr:response regulator [Dinghuibacter silviterrae]TDW99494.1 response regulator receiver domain-containing protein [Dinghuibacter silviterrae]